MTRLGSFSFTPTSHNYQFYDVNSGFTRLIMETKYVLHSLLSPHFSFHNDRTMPTVAFLVKKKKLGSFTVSHPLVKFQNKAIQKLFTRRFA